MSESTSKKIVKIFSTLDAKKMISQRSVSNLSDEGLPLNKRKFLIKVVSFALAVIVPYLLLVEFYLKEEKVTGSPVYEELIVEFNDWLENPENYPQFDDESVFYLDIYVALLSYNDRENIATYRIDILPSSALGFWEYGGQFGVYKTVRLNFDSLNAAIIGDYDSNTLQNSIEISVVGNNILESKLTDSNYFPFERKYSKISIRALYSDSRTIEEAVEKNDFIELPIRVYDFTEDLDGYKIRYDYLALNDNGYQKNEDLVQIQEELYKGSVDLLLTIQRDRASVFSVFALMAFVVGAAIALLLMTIVVFSKRRPPALASLIWGAATIFAIIETRRFIPNTPRVGVYMDLYLFFPSILISIFATSSLFALWIRRKDWVA
jgi:hypothetical protein